MKFIFALLSIIILSCNVNRTDFTITQNALPVDSLKKYSYSIIGIDPASNGQNAAAGSCFFFRKDNTLYLVTARHVLKDCVGERKKESMLFFIMIEDSTGLPTDGFRINAHQFQDARLCDSFGKTPDVIAVKVPEKKTINSVEKFIEIEFKEVKRIDIFGFPTKENLKYEGSVVYAKASHIHMDGKQVSFFKFEDSITKNFIDDELLIKTSQVVINPTLKGFSGSPMFIQSESGQWRLGGIFTGYTSNEKKHTFLTFATVEAMKKEIDGAN